MDRVLPLSFIYYSLAEQLRIAAIISSTFHTPVVVFSLDPRWTDADALSHQGLRYLRSGNELAVLSRAAQRTFICPSQYTEYTTIPLDCDELNVRWPVHAQSPADALDH
ncbi:hypothetical protein CBPV_s2gp1 [Chronic bee paralysis virus]|uniref:hypothetical protein n=1 Tax=Chronic bee paralysis virus TaxID=180822 RepID=UPI0001750241|nr:hypothetical protein CBPV_s2gp1 [Chronic bee paralysis virus]